MGLDHSLVACDLTQILVEVVRVNDVMTIFIIIHQVRDWHK